MSDSKSFLLAYHPANYDEAAVIDNYLSKGKYLITHLKSNHAGSVGRFADKIRDSAIPVIFLISDNFLKSEDCVYDLWNAFKSVRKLQEPIIIICDGKAKTGDETEPIKTSFSKLSGIIKYLNYWQNQYLESRAKKQLIREDEQEAFNRYLRVVRKISTEIGDFMKEINGLGKLEYADLTAKNFEPFYNQIGDNESFEYYLKGLADEVEAELAELTEPEPEEGTESGVPEFVKMSDEVGHPQAAADDEDEIIEVIVPAEEEPDFVLDLKTPEEVIEEVAQEEAQNMTTVEDAAVPAGDLNILFENDISAPVTASSDKGEINSILEQSGKLFKKDNKEGGLSALKEAVARFPDNTQLRYEYAVALVRYTRSYNLAKFHLKKNLEIHAGHPKTLFLLGKMAELDNELPQAIKYYKGVVDVRPDFPEANFRLALLSLLTDTGEREKIKKYLRKELELNPKNAEATYRLGTILAETESKYERALAYFDRVLELNPEHKFVNYDIALLYFKKNDLTNARLYYQKAYEINSELKTEENDIAFGMKQVIKTIRIESGKAEKNIKEELKDTKTILITGATSGIGKATARLFAEKGYRLILTGRRLVRLESIKTEFEKEFKAKVEILNFDVRDRKATEFALKGLPEDWKNIDILLNNAGLAKGFAPVHEGDFRHWETMIDTNVKGLLYMTRSVAPMMVENKSGHIINIGSIAGKEAYSNGNVYNATKYAVDGLTKAMRIDLHKYNIRVSQICPGHVEETEFAEVRFDGDKERAKIYEDFQPLTSKDVAETIYFIATRPAHVNIADVLITATQQATATIINKTGRGEEQ